MKFFSKRSNVLYITRNSLSVVSVLDADKSKPKVLKTVLWVPETMSDSLKTLAGFFSIFSSGIPMLIHDELSFVLSLAVSKEESCEREDVQKAAEEFVPDSLANTVWDYKEMFLARNSVTGAETKFLQVVALPEKISNVLIEAFRKSRLRIGTMEPISCSLARELSKEKLPLWIIYAEEGTTLILVDRGLVFLAETLDHNITLEDIGKFEAFATERFKINPQKILICGPRAEDAHKSLKSSKYTVQKSILDPFVILMQKYDVLNTKQLALNLGFTLKRLIEQGETDWNKNREKEASIDQAKLNQKDILTAYGATGAEELVESIQEKYINRKWRIRFTIMIISFLLVAAAVGFFSTYQRIRQERLIQVALESSLSRTNKDILRGGELIASTTALGQTTSSLEDGSSLVETKQDPSEYFVKVLNGSGKPGEAKRITQELALRGFENITTGNAKTFNYKDSIIQYKPHVDSAVKTGIEAVVGSIYNIEVDTNPLEINNTVDIIIITGQALE